MLVYGSGKLTFSMPSQIASWLDTAGMDMRPLDLSDCFWKFGASLFGTSHPCMHARLVKGL